MESLVIKAESEGVDVLVEGKRAGILSSSLDQQKMLIHLPVL
jgi:hypothetical protein